MGEQFGRVHRPVTLMRRILYGVRSIQCLDGAYYLLKTLSKEFLSDRVQVRFAFLCVRISCAWEMMSYLFSRLSSLPCLKCMCICAVDLHNVCSRGWWRGRSLPIVRCGAVLGARCSTVELSLFYFRSRYFQTLPK